MTNLSTGQLRTPNIVLRAQNAVRISTYLILALVGTLGLYIYLAWATDAWQLWVVTITTLVSNVLNVLALRFSRQRRVETAAYLMITGILLILPVATYLLSGVGLTLGIGGWIAIYMIARLTLVPPQLTWANAVGVTVSFFIVLLDVFFPSPRLAVPVLVIFMPVVAVIGTVIFGYYIAQEFSNYPLRTKLVIFFVMVAAFSVGTVAFVTNTLARNAIAQQVGQLQHSLAVRHAFEIAQQLEASVENMQATATQFEEFAASSNDLHVGASQEILNQIIEVDGRWRAADDDNLLIRSVTENEFANELREFQEAFPGHVELFVTDKFGANIAATNRTTDYYQGDEEWWQVAYSQGQGNIYIGQPEFDESIQVYSLILAIPLTFEGEIAGVFRSTLDVSTLIQNLGQTTAGDSTAIDLRIANDILLNGDPLDQIDLANVDRVMGTFEEIVYRGEPRFVSQERVLTSASSPVYEAISQLGWSVIVHRDLDDALAPVQQQTRVITLVALLITILVGILGLVASQRLAEPILSLTAVTGQVAEGDLSIRAHITTQDEIGTLATSINRMTNQLQDTLGGLERRVAERTADLELSRLVSERRAQELQSISEISRTISTEQRLEILLPLVTRLVSERFDFYHVGIFFVDDTKQFAVLQASNSEGGKRMLARGHRLEVGVGLVGTVVLTGRARVALDVGSDAVYFDNPDLPGTRSEMSLPLNFRGETIGVLDVQSIKPGAFTADDTHTLGILADQIAIAIENARLFGQTQQARDEAENLYNQFLRTEWKTFLHQDQKIGYRQTVSGGQALQKPVQKEEIRQALQEGRVVVLDGNHDTIQPSMAVPVKLRGQTIGVLNITSSKNRKWNQDEISLAQAISDRLALALDNARLLQESQRRAAKEAKIGEVTSKIGASINMRNVLQTAVEELGRALPGSEVLIQFQNSQEN